PFRRAANDLQSPGGKCEDAHRGNVVRKRDALFVDQEDAAALLAELESDRNVFLDIEPSQQAGDVDAGLAESDDARQPRRAKRFRRRQEVDRLEKIGLSLAIAADDQIGRGMKVDRAV